MHLPLEFLCSHGHLTIIYIIQEKMTFAEENEFGGSEEFNKKLVRISQRYLQLESIWKSQHISAEEYLVHLTRINDALIDLILPNQTQ